MSMRKVVGILWSNDQCLPSALIAAGFRSPHQHCSLYRLPCKGWFGEGDEGECDADTRWALAWFEQPGFNEGPYGDAETLSKANTRISLVVFASLR